MMELISKKTEQIVVRRTQKEDFQKIHEFHKNRVLCPLPSYFKNALESSSAISLIAYVGTHLAGHVLVLPLSSQQNIEKKEAAAICGVWAQEKAIEEILLRETMMSSWEEGFDVLFAFEKYKSLEMVGFQLAERSYFAMDVKQYTVLGVELSWNGFDKINKDLTLPKIYLPLIDRLKTISKN